LCNKNEENKGKLTFKTAIKTSPLVRNSAQL